MNKQKQMESDEFQWILDNTQYSKDTDFLHSPPYGDVTELNTCRLIMDAVGKDKLKKIAESAIDMIETSVAIYEVNGDYAFGMFSSGWCRMMDTASRELCRTSDNRKALSCGRWLCHDNCWNDSAKKAIETGKSTDIPCVGGIHLYAEPIFAHGNVAGAINIGYGDPPKDSEQLDILAEKFGVDPEKLKAVSCAYKKRPAYIVENAKKLLGVFARLIGEIVEKSQTQKKLTETRNRLRHQNAVLQAIRNIHRLIYRKNEDDRLLYRICKELTDTRGYYSAWALLVDKSHNIIDCFEAGLEDHFLPSMKEMKTAVMMDCIRRALSTNAVITTRRSSSDYMNCFLPENDSDMTAMTCRLAHDERIFGVLTVYLPADLADDREEQSLFQELCNDIGFGLYSFEQQKHREQVENALIESEKVMRYIIKYDPNAIAVFDRNLHYIAVSDRYLQDYNVKEENILGRHHYEVFPDIPRKWRDVHRRAIGGVTERNDDDGFERLDGSYIHTRWECRPWYKSDGSIGGMITYTEVTTERKLAEKALRAGEEKYKLLVENQGEGIGITDENEIFLYANPAAERIFGVGENELANRSLIPFLSEEGVAFVTEETQKRKKGIKSTYEIDIVQPSGNKVNLLITATPKMDEKGNFLGSFAVFRDITDRKKMEAALRESEERFRTLLENLPGGVFVHDTHGRFVLVNKAACENTGYSRDELMKLSVQDIAVETVPLEKKLKLWTTISQGEARRFESTHIRKDGTRYPVEIILNMIRLDKKPMIMAVALDISERKHAEEKLRYLQKAESLGRMAGAIAHYFNNVLTTVIGYVEMAIEDAPPGTLLSENLIEAERGAYRASQMSHMMLTYLGKEKMVLETINLSQVCIESVDALRSEIPDQIIHQMDIRSPESFIHADRKQIEQVLNILITNAWEAFEKNSAGKIHIVVEKTEAVTIKGKNRFPKDFELEEEAYVRLSVSDTGRGMDNPMIEHIFDPFYSTKFIGRGLGLAVALGIVKAHKGCLTVESEPGRGTSFHMFLPLCTVPRNEPGR